MRATKQSLVGRTIVDVDFRPFDNQRGGRAHNPVLTLDNGRRVYFMVEETEVAAYGISIRITEPSRSQASLARS